MPEKTRNIRSKICGEEDKMQPRSNLTPRFVICTAKEPFKQVIKSSMVGEIKSKVQTYNQLQHATLRS